MLTEDNLMELSKNIYHKNIYFLYFAIECVGIKMDFPQTPLVSIVAATASGPGGVLCDVRLNFLPVWKCHWKRKIHCTYIFL